MDYSKNIPENVKNELSNDSLITIDRYRGFSIVYKKGECTVWKDGQKFGPYNNMTLLQVRQLIDSKSSPVKSGIHSEPRMDITPHLEPKIEVKPQQVESVSKQSDLSYRSDRVSRKQSEDKVALHLSTLKGAVERLTNVNDRVLVQRVDRLKDELELVIEALQSLNIDLKLSQAIRALELGEREKAKFIVEIALRASVEMRNHLAQELT